MLDSNGRVLTPIVWVYQSNMLIHFWRQLVATKQVTTIPLTESPQPHQLHQVRPHQHSPPTPTDPTPKNCHRAGKAPCKGCPSPQTVGPTHLSKGIHTPSPPSISPLAPQLKTTLSTPPDPFSAAKHPGFPDHQSLCTIFQYPGCPFFIQSLHPETPLTSSFPLEDATHICQARWGGPNRGYFPCPREFISLDSNGDLYMSPNSSLVPDVVVTLYEEPRLPSDEQEDTDEVKFQLTPSPP